MPDLPSFSIDLEHSSIQEIDTARKGSAQLKVSVDANFYKKKLTDLYSHDLAHAPGTYAITVKQFAEEDEETSHPLRMAICSHVDAKTISNKHLRCDIAKALLKNPSEDEEERFELLEGIGDLSETTDNYRLYIDKEILQNSPKNEERKFKFKLQKRAIKRIGTYEEKSFGSHLALYILNDLPNSKKDKLELLELLCSKENIVHENEDMASMVDVKILEEAKNLSPKKAEKFRKAVYERILTYENPKLRSAVSQAIGFITVQKAQEDLTSVPTDAQQLHGQQERVTVSTQGPSAESSSPLLPQGTGGQTPADTDPAARNACRAVAILIRAGGTMIYEAAKMVAKETVKTVLCRRTR